MSKIPDPHLGAWRALLHAQAEIVGAVEEALRDADLPPLAWYDALLPLRTAGRPLRMGELAAEVVTTIGRTGLTRLVDRLAIAGMITREHSQADRRAVEVAITGQGVALLRRMWPVYSRVLTDRFVARLDTDAAGRLAADLARVVDPSAWPPRSTKGARPGAAAG